MGVLHWRPPLGPLRGCASAARLHCAAGRHRGPLRGWHCGAQQGGAGPSAGVCEFACMSACACSP
eukprot:1158163-Pelagomonas_calceolata.AAC.20